MTPFLYILGGCGVLVVVASAVMQWRWSRHRGMSRDTFVEEFTKTGIPREIPESAYDFCRSGVISRKFGVDPNEAYEDLFGYTIADIDFDAMRPVKNLNLRMPSPLMLKQYPTPVRTPRDMVQWLNWVRGQQETPRPPAVQPSGQNTN